MRRRRRHLAVASLSALSFACGSAGPAEEDSVREDPITTSGNLEERYRVAARKLERIFAADAASRGARVVVNMTIGDGPKYGGINVIREGGEWNVNVTFPAKPKLSDDDAVDVGSLVMCHELGHSMGGWPFVEYTDAKLLARNKTAKGGEGTSDYWAAQECMWRLFADESTANVRALASARPSVAQKCRAAHGGKGDRAAICARIAHAGELLIGTLGDSRASLDTPSQTVKDNTIMTYPSDQCRLDTYFAGALCAVRREPGHIGGLVVIDGAVDNPGEGRARDALRDSCASGPGARPACWFKSGDVYADRSCADYVPRCEGDTFLSCGPRSGPAPIDCAFLGMKCEPTRGCVDP